MWSFHRRLPSPWRICFTEEWFPWCRGVWLLKWSFILKEGSRITASVLSSAAVSGEHPGGRGMLDELQPRIHSCFQAVHTKNGGAGNMNRNRKFSAVFGYFFSSFYVFRSHLQQKGYCVSCRRPSGPHGKDRVPVRGQPTRAWTFSGNPEATRLLRERSPTSAEAATCSSQRTTW